MLELNMIPAKPFNKQRVATCYFMEISKLNNLRDLALYIDIDETFLYNVLFCIPEEKLYTEFYIEKKDKTPRIIHAPCYKLKKVQNALLSKITDDLKTSKDAGIQHAFTKGRNICTNAKWHKHKKILICIDIKDFFPSINFGRILGYLEKDNAFQLKKPVSVFVANLICFNNELPQGAPTSPLFSNLICRILDYRLLNIAKKYRMSCTRYADDITFSTNVNYSHEEINNIIEKIYNEILRAGFEPNTNKTRIKHPNQRQTVTGICVNKRINVTRDYYKNTRSMAYSLYRDGKFTINGKRGTRNQLEGRYQHIYSVDNHMCFAESEYKKHKDSAIKDVDNWNSHVVDYAIFITYKNLWKNNRIMVFCEGKTDPLYIKAALKSLSTKYPQLVSFLGNRYQYNLQFFNPQSKLNDVIGFCGEGGSRLINLVNFYNLASNKDNHSKRYSILPWLKNACPVYEAPVIILVDNEFKRDSPLKHIYNACKKFVSDKEYANLSDEEFKKKLDIRPYFNVVDNLYVLTYKRKNDEDIEIEDLLDTNYIEQKLSPRKFDRSGKELITNGFYNKRYLANFVSRHHQNMDFSQFEDFFDSLISLCKDCNDKRDQLNKIEN